MQAEIGEMAGQVWTKLNEQGSTTVAKLKTALKADAFLLTAALGWLSRENKVELSKKGNTVNIALK